MIEQFAASTESPEKKNLAKELLNDELTLEQKLELIDQAMADRVAEARDEAENLGIPYVPVDPSDAFQCIGCQ